MFKRVKREKFFQILKKFEYKWGINTAGNKIKTYSFYNDYEKKEKLIGYIKNNFCYVIKEYEKEL